MFLGDLLDDGGQRIGQGLGALAVAVVVALFVAVLIPVILVSSAPGLVVLAAARVAGLGSPRAPQMISGPGTEHPGQQGTWRHSAIQIARGYLGVPYRYGGSDPATGLDCSGLVQLVYRQLGMGLPRTAEEQYNATARVAPDQLRPGDLVFFAQTYIEPHDWITHVGIYIGDGQQISSPTEGQVVSIQPVFSGFWGAHFVSGGRIGGSLDGTRVSEQIGLDGA